MELFGITIKLNGKKNGYVKQRECHSAQQNIRETVKALEKHIDDRFEDYKDFFLRNGR